MDLCPLCITSFKVENRVISPPILNEKYNCGSLNTQQSKTYTFPDSDLQHDTSHPTLSRYLSLILILLLMLAFSVFALIAGLFRYFSALCLPSARFVMCLTHCPFWRYYVGLAHRCPFPVELSDYSSISPTVNEKDQCVHSGLNR